MLRQEAQVLDQPVGSPRIDEDDRQPAHRRRRHPPTQPWDARHNQAGVPRWASTHTLLRAGLFACVPGMGGKSPIRRQSE